MTKLYGNRQSRAARCLWLLEELGIPFEQVPVDLAAGANRTREYLAINPAGKVPTLVEDDFVLGESVAINLYLGGQHSTPLWPHDARTRALIVQWSCWATAEMEVPITALVRERRAAANAGREPDGGVIALQSEIASSTLVRLETALRGDSPFLIGAAFTLADINAATAVMLAPIFLDMEDFPRSVAWLERCLARDAWRRVQGRP